MSGWGNWGTSFGYADGSGDEDEEGDSDFQPTYTSKDSLIFLVDCSESMFQKPAADEENHFQLCIKCARSVLTNKIVSSDKDMLGVVFFGTEKNKNTGNFDHIYVLQDLDNPSAARILELEGLLEDDPDFKTAYGHNTRFSLSDALWTCSNMFSQSTQKIGHKRILLFTNNDDPHASDTAAQRQAKTKAKDLHEIGIDIELMHLTQPGKDFDHTKFYQDIIFSPDDEEIGVLPDASEKFEELLNRVRAKDHKKRSLGKLTFNLGPGLDLGVGVYNLVRAQTRPYPVKLYKKTNEQLKSKSRMFCEDTGELLMPTDIKKFQTYGGRNIVFEKEEIAELKNFGDTGLVLMGFLPRSSMERFYHVRPGQFLFPDENVVKGSTSLFSALLQKSLARKVIALCRYIPRKNATPFFVALIPQDEELDEHNVQVTPPGFHLVFLPYSEDIRELVLPEQPRANAEQIDKAKEVVKKLQFKFKSENFENPVLQTHYRNLEALALDRDKPEEIVDHTAPNTEMMTKRAGDKIREFKELVFPDGYEPGAKRQKAAGGGGAKPKPPVDVDMNEYAQQGKLGKLTVAVLKEFCSKNGLSTAGKKNDLVQTISGHFGVYRVIINILYHKSGWNQDKVEGQGEVGGASQAFPQRRQQETPRQYQNKTTYNESRVNPKSSGHRSGSGQASQRWVPPSSGHSKPEYHSTQAKHNHIFRRVRGILNKLTPEKFDKLVLELLNVGIDSKVVLKGIILLVFDKALEEPKYSTVYAQLCRRLDEDAPSFEPPGSTGRTFRRLLINKCQDEFENRTQAFAAFDNKNGQLTADEEEQRHITKHKMLGNIQFIGELGKLAMLHESILHKCIKQLLFKRSSETFREKAEDLECLCKIMTTVGRRLDHDKARSWMDQYFERMMRFSETVELPARIRFMLQDCLELRRNNWVFRHVALVQGPRTLRQIHQESYKDAGMSHGMGRSHGDFFGSLNGDRGMHGAWDQQGGHMSDIFLQDTMSGKVGTGPGTIEMEPYANFMMQHQQQMRNAQRNVDRQNQGSYQGNYNNQPPRLQQQMNPQGMGMGLKDGIGGGGGGGYVAQRSNPSGQRDSKPPRMGKMNSEQINLRPNASTMLLKPQGPSMLPPSAKKTPFQPAPSLIAPKPTPPPSSTQPPVSNLQSGFPPLSVKQTSVSLERGKPAKKQAPTKEELVKALDSLFKTYLTSDDLTAAVDGWKDLRVPDEQVAALLCHIMVEALTKGDTEREGISKLITALRQNNSITAAHFTDGFTSLLGHSTDLEAEVPLIKSHIASYASRAIIDDAARLDDIARPLESGAYYPLFLLCLQKLHKMKDKEWLVNLFGVSKVNMMLMLPEIDQRKERMMDILEDKGLSFLFPLLRVQSDIWKQITTEPNPSSLYKWIRDNIPSKLHTDKGFINALATSIIKFVTSQTTLAEGVDPSIAPDKTLQDKEKSLLEKFKPVLLRFIHESVALQLSALYALQVHCHNNGFPKGMLLRFFVNFYNLEVVEEEAFLKWKEDITDEHPGKGKALFQVNQWLTWLATAEEEEDSEDEDPDQ